MKKHLTFKQKILVAGTLFGMFFGAGNLIFPVHLGQLAGSHDDLLGCFVAGYDLQDLVCSVYLYR